MVISPFLNKLLEDTFKDVSDRKWHWYSTLYWYIIDSKEITRKRLDSFLKEQINHPDEKVLNLALNFAKYRDSDRIGIEILKWADKNIQYASDTLTWGRVEKWATAWEVLTRWYVKNADGNLKLVHTGWDKPSEYPTAFRADDCDSKNGLIYVLFGLASSAIMDNYLYCCIGDVIMPDGSTTGHYWLVYISPKTGKVYPIDGTYYTDLREIGKGRKTFKLGTQYKDVWFYFNSSQILKQKQ